jgi:hypothetical protein
MAQSTSRGVGPATVTLPSGSAKVLGTVRRETISDPNFYGQFFALVQNYVDQERVSQASMPALTHPAPPLQSESPPPVSQVSAPPAGSQVAASQLPGASQ